MPRKIPPLPPPKPKQLGTKKNRLTFEGSFLSSLEKEDIEELMKLRDAAQSEYLKGVFGSLLDHLTGKKSSNI